MLALMCLAAVFVHLCTWFHCKGLFSVFFYLNWSFVLSVIFYFELRLVSWYFPVNGYKLRGERT